MVDKVDNADTKYGNFGSSEDYDYGSNVYVGSVDPNSKREDRAGGIMEDKVDDMYDDDGTMEGAIYNWTQGDNVSGDQMDTIVEWATFWDSSELDAIQEKGFSEELINAMKVIQTMNYMGYSDSQINNAMKTYMSMSAEDKATVVDSMIEYNVTHKFHSHIKIGQGDDSMSFEGNKIEDMDLTKEAQQAVAFLVYADPDTIAEDAESNPDTTMFSAYMNEDFQSGTYESISEDYQSSVNYLARGGSWANQDPTAMDCWNDIIDGMGDVVEGNVSSADGAGGDPVDYSGYTYANPRVVLTSSDLYTAIKDAGGLPATQEEIETLISTACPTFDSLGASDKQAVVDWLVAAQDENNLVDENGNIWTENGVDANGDPTYKLVMVMPGVDPDAEDNFMEEMNISALMFYVLMGRMDNQEELIRHYGDLADAKNNMLSDANAVVDAVTTAKAEGDGNCDVEDIDVTLHDGTTMTVSEFIETYEIDIGDDLDLGDLSDAEAEALIGKLNSFADKCSTDAQSETQSLNQAVSRYETTSTQLSNYSKSKSSLDQEINANLK